MNDIHGTNLIIAVNTSADKVRGALGELEAATRGLSEILNQKARQVLESNRELRQSNDRYATSMRRLTFGLLVVSTLQVVAGGVQAYASFRDSASTFPTPSAPPEVPLSMKD